MFLSGIIALLSNIFLFMGYVKDERAFPKPLDKESEQKCIEKVIAGDKRAKDELVGHNMRLVVHIAQKYTNFCDSDELIGVGSIGLVKAVNTYKGDKGTQFATYASKCIENEILMFIRANKKHKNNKSLYEPISYDKEGNEVTLLDVLAQDDESVLETVENKIVSEKLVSIIKANLSERDGKIMLMRYGLGGYTQKTQQEIADIFNISRSYVSRIETSSLLVLRKYMNKNNLFFS